MKELKLTYKYYFSVEGETEKWYLEWLQQKINLSQKALYHVSFDCVIQKNPLKRAKSLVMNQKTEIWHISDYESNDEYHMNEFKETMNYLKASTKLGKQIEYRFGYSNFTFDLWILLHMIDSYRSYHHRRDYLPPINKAFHESFESMDEYKKEANFKRCLRQMDLEHVKAAIKRAKTIMKNNESNGYVLQHYKGFQYYNENPSLAVWEIIEKIMNTCQL